MLIFFLVLFGCSEAQQELCYEGPGDVYSGGVNVTDLGNPCEPWSRQRLIALEKDVDHNYCRAYQNMSSRPYCVYRGQMQLCDVERCDSSTLRFEGYSIIVTRNNMSRTFLPIVAQQINFYFKVLKDYSQSAAVLVRVRSRNDTRQHFSVILQSGFLRLVVSLDSYNAERIVFGGPIATGAVHYVSVNRSRSRVFMQLNNTITNYTLTSKETEFLVSPYQVIVGDNFYGCMTGLSVGSWLQNGDTIELVADKPLQLFTVKELSDSTVARTKVGTPLNESCMFAPTTIVQNNYIREWERSSGFLIDENAVEAVERSPKRGALDKRSIIIISVALGVIFTLTLVTLICVKRNQHYTPQGYNLEVM